LLKTGCDENYIFDVQNAGRVALMFPYVPTHDTAIAGTTRGEVVPVFVEFEVAVPHLRPAGW